MHPKTTVPHALVVASFLAAAGPLLLPAFAGQDRKPAAAIREVVTPLGVRYVDLQLGQGDEAQTGKIVEVHYVGVSWATGNQFDASWDRGDTFKFGLGKGQVIKGWDEGVAGMKVGGRRRITIPPQLAYGKRGAGGVIGPDETLVFVVDLVGVR